MNSEAVFEMLLTICLSMNPDMILVLLFPQVRREIMHLLIVFHSEDVEMTLRSVNWKLTLGEEMTYHNLLWWQ